MKKLLRNKKGFTLIELIVVILILAVLAAILVPSIMNYVGKARDSRDQANARTLWSEISIKEASEDLDVDDYSGEIDLGDSKCTVLFDDDSLTTVTCGTQVYNGSTFTTTTP